MSQSTRAPAEAVWRLWTDPERWSEWDQRIVSAAAEGDELEVGTTVRVKMRKGGNQMQRVSELDHEQLLVTEWHFPGARIAHRHALKPADTGSEITHAITISGPLWVLWALMLGRGRLRKAVAEFIARERELVEPPPPRSKRRRRRKR